MGEIRSGAFMEGLCKACKAVASGYVPGINVFCKVPVGHSPPTKDLDSAFQCQRQHPK